MLAGMMPSKGNPPMRPFFVPIVIKTHHRATDVGEDNLIHRGDRRGGGVVAEQAGEIRNAHSRDRPAPEFHSRLRIEAEPEDVSSGFGIAIDLLVTGYEDLATKHDRRPLSGVRKRRPPPDVIAQRDAELGRSSTLRDEVSVRPGRLGPRRRTSGTRGRKEKPDEERRSHPSLGIKDGWQDP